MYNFHAQPMVITFASIHSAPLELLISLTLKQVYSSFLSIISLLSRSLSNRATRHNNLLLLLTFGVYAYRDIWPLATYFLEPVDGAEGKYLWAKISILAVTSIVIPLCIPSAYVPVDPDVSCHLTL